MQGASGSNVSRHEGVRCSSCSRANFRGRRYKCLICYDYNLCERCYDARVPDPLHNAEHAVQCILTPMDYELYYGGEATQLPQSFTCPMCATMGFALLQLRDHIWAHHGDTEVHVVCPACAAISGGDPISMTGDLAMHLTVEHTRYRDSLDAQSTLQRLQGAALTGVRGTTGGHDRGLRPQRSPSTVSVTPLSSPDLQSVTRSDLLSQRTMEGYGTSTLRASRSRTISDLLSRGTTGTFGTSTLEEARNTVAGIERIRLRYQTSRQAFQQQNRRPLRDLLPPTTTSQEPAPVHPNPTSVETPDPDDPRFLLPSCVEPSLGYSQQRALEVERANRSLFLQELLLITLSELELGDDDEQCCEPQPAEAAMHGEGEAPTTGRVPTALTSPENIESIRLDPILTPSLEEMAPSSRELTATARLPPTPPTSLEPTATTSLGLTATTNVNPDASRIRGLPSPKA